MRVDVNMDTEKDEFRVSSWWAKTPEFVISSLKSQLEAAQAVWPELKKFSLVKKRDHSKQSPDTI